MATTTTAPAAGDLRPGYVQFSVLKDVDGLPVSGASCSLYRLDSPGTAKRGASKASPAVREYIDTAVTDAKGWGEFLPQPPNMYEVECHNGIKPTAKLVKVESERTSEVPFELALGPITVEMELRPADAPQGGATLMRSPREGDVVAIAIACGQLQVVHPTGTVMDPTTKHSHWTIPSAGEHALHFAVLVPDQRAGKPIDPQKVPDAWIDDVIKISSGPLPTQPISGNLNVALTRTAATSAPDLFFWEGILNSTENLSFNNYLQFMNKLFCGDEGAPAGSRFRRAALLENDRVDELLDKRRLPFTDSDAYRVIKAATEAFVMVNCGVLKSARAFGIDRTDYLKARDLPRPLGSIRQAFSDKYLVEFLGGGPDDRTLPYLAVIRSKLPDIAIKLPPLGADPETYDLCAGFLQEKLTDPCLLELIWSYWHEEGMLVQTMNAITRRFQNVRSHARDPLANLEIDPLRPLNNVLWGYVQDEQHRLSIVRRNYEYDHHYGLRLEGKAVRSMQAADSRSRFLEAFHNLLRLCTTFYKQDDDTTVHADAFPVLNALKEVHLILSQGAHNQFGDLPSTARIEMLMQQWLLARPEFREFLPTRIMTAYPEAWMDRVDAMKKVQGWTDTSVLHFRNLAVFGEQILLSIRWGHWSDVQDPRQAFNWARFFRPQIQGYSHAYRSVTGVVLARDAPDARIDATLPSVLLQRRLATQQRIA